MTPIDSLPNLDWNEIARREIIITGANLIAQSDFAFQIGRVAIAGLIYHNYLSPPWFWFALAKGVTMRDLIDFRKLRDEIPQGAMTAVCVDWPHAIRFAEFYGFVYTGEERIYDGKTYKMYRRT